MPAPLLVNTALTVFRVRLRTPMDDLDLTGPVMIDDEDEEPGHTRVSTADPDAADKLAAHPAVEHVEQIGHAAFIADWRGPTHG